MHRRPESLRLREPCVPRGIHAWDDVSEYALSACQPCSCTSNSHRIERFSKCQPGFGLATYLPLLPPVPCSRTRFGCLDRDSIVSAELDGELQSFGLKVLRTPVRAPQANAYCERLIAPCAESSSTLLIPLGERLCSAKT